MSEKKIAVKLDRTSDAPEKLKGRDTIYIDIDDDITAIIEKIKKSENSVVALVPPKRVSALQSAVNLKLLLRAAKTAKKKVAIVTTDTALTNLAAVLRIPVARSLTSQAAILDAPDFDEIGDDVINGNEMAVGELAKLPVKERIARRDSREDKEISAAVAAIETDDNIKNDRDADGVEDSQQKKTKAARAKKQSRIPNFNKFRKILFIGGGALILLIAFLVWAIGFAPKATITISTKTRAVSVDGTMTLANAESNPDSDETNADENPIQPIVKQIKKTETLNFEATGEKEVGEKATGTVVIRNCVSWIEVTIKAGTIMSDNNNRQFALNADTKVPGGSGNFVTGCTKAGESAPVGVTAVNIGEEYNINSNRELTVQGGYTAKPQSAFSGGTKEKVKVVSEEDLEKAAEELKNRFNDEIKDQVKEELKGEMGDGVSVIDSSFESVFGEASSKPALDTPAENGKATATLEATYTLIGISNADLESWLETQIKTKAEISDDNPQEIYDDGLLQATFDFNKETKVVRIRTNAKIGAILDEEKIKENAVGKQAGVIAADIEKIVGVDKAEVKLSPFWVKTAPSAKKITVEILTNEE